MISALILTKNEVNSIGRALTSLRWCDDVVVLDAASSDGTPDRVLQFGVRLVQPPPWGLERPFGGHEGNYRNWAIHALGFKHPWLLVLDADEALTPDAAASMQAAVRSTSKAVAYTIQRRDFFQGIWLRHVQTTAHYIRLFRPDCVRYSRSIHPVITVDGAVGALHGYLDHEPFSKGIADWVTRHNHYSSLEAGEILRRIANTDQPSTLWSDLVGAFSPASAHTRRVHQKRLFYRLPARPLVKFMLLYGIKRGFLDGRAGLTYALLSAFYEYLIVIKQQEAKANLKAA